MRILRIAQRIPPLPGGEEYHVLELTRRQLQQGHQVRLVFQSGDASEFGAYARQVGSPFGLTDSALGASIFGLEAGLTGFQRGAQVCHLHGDFTDAAFHAATLRARHIPSILTVHGGLNMRYRRLAAPIYRSFQRIIALGMAATEDLLQHGVQPRRIITMSSGLNRGLLDKATELPSEVGRVVAVGSLIELKNFSTLITAFRAVLDDRASLTIVGGGPLDGQLRALASGDTRIRFTGDVDRRTAYQVVARSQVFVMPSRRLLGKGEGVPTALLEAMYLGKDCLVSREAEPRPVVSDPQSYTTFNPLDAGELARLIHRAIADPRQSEIRSKRARQAVAHLGWDRIAERVEEIYRQAIQEFSSGR